MTVFLLFFSGCILTTGSDDRGDASTRDVFSQRDANECPANLYADGGCIMCCLDESILNYCTPSGPMGRSCGEDFHCLSAQCVANVVDAGTNDADLGYDASECPDSGASDAGCVTCCIDQYMLNACSSDGVAVTLHCPTDYHCRSAGCVENDAGSAER